LKSAAVIRAVACLLQPALLSATSVSNEMLPSNNLKTNCVWEER